jgi:hypothetical protein
MSRKLCCVATAVVCLATGPLARAQQAADTSTPAHVSAVDGRALFERDGRTDSAVENLPLLEGDRVRTEDGRLEMLLPDGSVVALDRYTTLDLLAGGVARLSTGRIVFVVAGWSGGTPRSYRVEAPAGAVITSGAGEFRITTFEEPGRRSVDLAVVSGEATLATSRGSSLVQAGRRAMASEGQDVEPPQPFNPAQADAFYAWADGLRAARAGSRSNAYLPEDLKVYSGAFDRGGTWQSSPDYGYVWYPTVADDWRPYYDGSWQPYSWGWTWVGAGAWTWPTHHYGRWGYGGRGWYWIPSATWGPAWVSWGIAADYVSWCPLGYNNYPVFGLSFGVGFGFGLGFSFGYDHGYGYGYGHNPWRGWTVVPHGYFGGSYHVPSHAVHGDGLRAVERASFAVTRTGPSVPGRAVPRYANVGGAQPYGHTSAGAGRPTASDRRGPFDAALAAGRNPGAASGQPPSSGQDRTSGGRTPPTASAGSRSYSAAPSYAAPRASGAPSSSAVPRSYSPASSSGAPRAYGAPLSSVGPRSYAAAPSNAAPRTYGAPPSTAGPRTYSAAPSSGAPRAYGAPSSSAVPRAYSTAPSYSAPRTYAAPPASAGSRSYPSAPSYSTPRSYGLPPSSARPRSYSPAPSYSAPRSYGAAPSYAAPRSYSNAPSYSAPRSYGPPPASAGPRSYSNAPSYSAPRSYGPPPASAGPRSYSSAPSRSAPRSYGAPSPSGTGRAPSGGGGARPSGGGPSGGARKR